MFAPVTFSCSSLPCQGPSSSQLAPLLVNFFSILLTLCVIGIIRSWTIYQWQHHGKKSSPLATLSRESSSQRGGTSLMSPFPPVMPCWRVSSVAVSPRVQQTVSCPRNTVSAFRVLPLSLASFPPLFLPSFLSLGQRVIQMLS